MSDRVRREVRDAIVHLFEEVVPRISEARLRDDELNRFRAHRFNTLDVLRPKELGLSAIVAHLLDPSATHGQGTLFLEKFLHCFGSDSVQPCGFDQPWLETDLSRAQVFTERTIEKAMKIDIYISIPSTSGEFCIAIENKPFAGDIPRQLQNYIEHLKRRTERKEIKKWKMIYMSGDGWPPSCESLGSTNLTELRDSHGLLIVPYYRGRFHGNQNQDGFQDFRTSNTILEWLASCLEDCHAQKLRFFLKDFESYVKTKFGNAEMTSNVEVEEVTKYLLENPERLRIAESVSRAWLTIRDDLFARFLEHLRKKVALRIRELDLTTSENLVIKSQFNNKTPTRNELILYSKGWHKHERDVSQWNTEGRTAVVLECGDKEFSYWYLGVCSPSSNQGVGDDALKTRKCLEQKLEEKLGKSKTSPWYRWYKDISAPSEPLADWTSGIVNIAKELPPNQDGEVTNFFVGEFVELVKQTFDIIQEIEGPKKESV